jgi:chemotaxis protein histidine kinase CheA
MAREHPIELFMPPNMLKAKVGGLFSGIDMAAIKRAETAMETLKSEFTGWAAEDVQRLAAARDAFAKRQDAPARAALMRVAHDMKGQAATFDFPMIGRAAASLCRLLDETPAKNPVPPGLVDAHVSTIHAIFRDKVTDTDNPVAVALVEELEARVGEALGTSAKI